MRDLLNEFNSKAANLVDEAINKYKYRDKKIAAREWDPALDDVEQEFRDAILTVSLKMGEIKRQIFLKADKNKELSIKLGQELQRHILRFIKETAPPSLLSTD